MSQVTQEPFGNLTAHNVLLGEGTLVPGYAPPVTAGYVLTDNGVGADPTFQPLAELQTWAQHAQASQTFTAQAGTWTVASGNYTAYYNVVGKTMFFNVYISTSTLSSDPSYVTLVLPASHTVLYEFAGGTAFAYGGTASGSGLAYCGFPASSNILLTPNLNGSADWSNGGTLAIMLNIVIPLAT